MNTPKSSSSTIEQKTDNTKEQKTNDTKVLETDNGQQNSNQISTEQKEKDLLKSFKDFSSTMEEIKNLLTNLIKIISLVSLIHGSILVFIYLNSINALYLIHSEPLDFIILTTFATIATVLFLYVILVTLSALPITISLYLEGWVHSSEMNNKKSLKGTVLLMLLLPTIVLLSYIIITEYIYSKFGASGDLKFYFFLCFITYAFLIFNLYRKAKHINISNYTKCIILLLVFMVMFFSSLPFLFLINHFKYDYIENIIPIEGASYWVAIIISSIAIIIHSLYVSDLIVNDNVSYKDYGKIIIGSSVVFLFSVMFNVFTLSEMSMRLFEVRDNDNKSYVYHFNKKDIEGQLEAIKSLDNQAYKNALNSDFINLDYYAAVKTGSILILCPKDKFVAQSHMDVHTECVDFSNIKFQTILKKDTHNE